MKKVFNLLATGGLLLSLLAQPLMACINTTYSRADEVEITNELLPLILGSFPHHGWAFYEQEINRTQNILAQTPKNFDARNDLGAAYTKHKLWSMAQTEFEKNENLHPSRYETASNLGVMFKKKGDYQQSEKYISKALEIKPAGHMGLGDYYLKMIQWLGTAEKRSDINLWNSNFLGTRYDQGPEVAAQVANEEYIITLIKNDYQFVDAYTVLGDILFSKGDLQMALRAYHRALDLSQQSSVFSHSHYVSIIYARIQKISETWQSQKNSGYVIEHDNGIEQISQEIQDAAKWLDQFQEIEAEYISENKPTPFHAVLAEMKSRGISEPTVLEAGFYKGSESTAGAQDSLLAILIVFILPLIAVIIGAYLIIRLVLRRLRARLTA